jgi:sulfonate transport system substrate-binding protein
LLAKTNDVPIKAVYIYEQPEWTALVVGKDSPIVDPRELRGKKVAATRGTDPYFFLLRTLNANGLSQSDVELVDLHPSWGSSVRWNCPSRSDTSDQSTAAADLRADRFPALAGQGPGRMTRVHDNGLVPCQHAGRAYEPSLEAVAC